MIPISKVVFGAEEEENILSVLRSGLIAQGAYVQAFETEFAKMCGVKHAIAVSNGTLSLVAAIQVLDLEVGSEIVTSPFTFVATVNAALQAGAVVRFADISEDDFNLDADSVRPLINEKTAAIMPVHLYGQMADMKKLSDIAMDHQLTIIEDAAQAHGAMFNGQSAGSIGIGSFSFYATKNLTSGEGGIITTNDDAVATKLRIMRNQGMTDRYVYVMAGHNFRMTDLQAAIVLPQTERYGLVLKKRRSNADFYAAAFADLVGVVTPRELPGRSHVWHQYTLRITGDAKVSRDEFIAKLTEFGVGSGIYYPKLITEYATYREHPNIRLDETPVASQIVQEVVSIPVHHHLSGDELRLVADRISDLLR